MSRWRPPQKPGSPYITEYGYLRLEAESTELWQRRREVVKHLAAAAAEGDRSENAEYIYRKKELAQIDRRIRYLQRRMPNLNVVRDLPSDRNHVFFGARVELEDDSGNVEQYHIVGSDETEFGEGRISVDSPVAKALLKRSVDDEVVVQTAGGTRRLIIIDITYDASTTAQGGS